MTKMNSQYLHVNYIPKSGWVLSIMSSLLQSSNPQLREAFDRWSDTPLKELGFAITTRMHMLGLCIRRLNTRVEELRKEMNADTPQVEACLSRGYAFTFKDNDLAYQLLLDMDSFIFETRSLYEIVGKFLVALFQLLFDRKMTDDEVQSLLSIQGIDTRWIGELRDARKLFFHETAPWLAVQVERESNRFDPVLLKRQPITFEDSTDLVEFAALREIYEGFVNSVTELHRYIKEQIRLAETAAPKD
jgi:hypothetical protein